VPQANEFHLWKTDPAARHIKEYEIQSQPERTSVGFDSLYLFHLAACRTTVQSNRRHIRVCVAYVFEVMNVYVCAHFVSCSCFVIHLIKKSEIIILGSSSKEWERSLTADCSVRSLIKSGTEQSMAMHVYAVCVMWCCYSEACPGSGTWNLLLLNEVLLLWRDSPTRAKAASRKGHTQRHTIVGRTPPPTPDEGSARHTRLGLTTYTKLTRYRHSCPRRHSNPHFQQAIGRRSSP
jgi:hypothetical protein